MESERGGVGGVTILLNSVSSSGEKFTVKTLKYVVYQVTTSNDHHLIVGNSCVVTPNSLFCCVDDTFFTTLYSRAENLILPLASHLLWFTESHYHLHIFKVRLKTPAF